jgi:hypothetical protein
VQDGYHANRGKLTGPDGFEVVLAEHVTIEDYGLLD